MKTKLAIILLAATIIQVIAQPAATPPQSTNNPAAAAIQEFLEEGNPPAQPNDAATEQVPPPAFPPPVRVQNGTGQATNGAPTSLPGVNAATAATDPDPDADDEIIQTDFLRLEEGANIDNLLDFYELLVDRIILRPGTLPEITNMSLDFNGVELTRREAIQALDTYLALNNISTVRMGEKFLLVVPRDQASREAGKFSNVEPSALPEAAQFTSHIVQLKYVLPSEIVGVLEYFTKSDASLIAIDSSQTLVIRDYAVNVKRILEVIEQIDVAVPAEYVTELIPIKYALASDIASVLGGLTSSGSVTTVGNSSASGFGGAGLGGGSTFGNNTGAGNFNSANAVRNTRGAYNTFNTMQTATPVPVGRGSTAAARSTFQNRLNQIVSSVGGGGQGEVEVLGETKVIADERTNSLLVFATREDMETIKDIVARMDVVLAQVLIEAILMEVNIGDAQTVSVSAGARNEEGNATFTSLMNNGLGFSNFGGATNISSFGGDAPTGFTWLGEFNEQYAVAINLAAQDSRIKVLSRPRVQTSHAVPANLFVGERRPYVTGTFSGGFNSGVSSQYQQQQIGLSLRVLPLINPEGLVVMDIEQEVQQVAGSVEIDGNDVPITQDQSANAKVAVKDRDTVILGGFIRNSIDENESGVPWLKDIPLLGNLFKSKNNSNSRRELVILIRPTVLPTPDDAAKLVDSYKDTTPILKEAEVDFETEEQRLLKEANENIMRKRLGIEED